MVAQATPRVVVKDVGVAVGLYVSRFAIVVVAVGVGLYVVGREGSGLICCGWSWELCVGM